MAVLIWANLRQQAGQSAAADSPTGPAGAPLVKVVKVERRDLTQLVLAPGAVEPLEYQLVRTPFPSPSVHLLAGPGDRVTEGQALAELDRTEIARTLASLEVAAGRAESALAQLRREQEYGPRQRTLRIRQAELQLMQATEALAAMAAQPSAARQRVEQALAALTALQARATGSGEQVDGAARAREAAEAAYRAAPLDPAARSAFEQARTAYEEAVRRAEDEARQLAAELAAADETLTIAEADLAHEGESAGLIQARHQVESANQALEAARLEAEAGEVLREQVRAAEAELAAARESLEEGRRQLNQAMVRAPIGGIVLELGVQEGQPAQQNQLLLRIGNLDRLKALLRVDELDIGKVAADQSLTVRSGAFQGERFQGRISRVAAHASESVGGPGSYFEVQGLVENPDGLLRSGMRVESRIQTGVRSNAIVVGLESIREGEGKDEVLVVADAKVRVRPVEIGLRTQTEAEVLSGLVEGDLVIVSPFTLLGSLKDGDAVRHEQIEWTRRGEPT